ncbi:MAG: capsule assembly Wzi family protein, partial [Steroidobacteraceae bacterium]
MFDLSARTRLVFFTLLLAAQQADARGVSPYLPLNLSPMIERQIERAMILAGQPVMRRPIAAAAVLDALPAVCEVDPGLCAVVRSYLQSYMRDSGVTLFQVQANAAVGDTKQVIPNAHGKSVDSIWQVAASGFYQPFDHLLLSAGGVGYDGEVTPTGTLLSAGFDFAQLDIGYRDHWLSPMSDSSILISTEAPTMPSVTLSNAVPLGPLGISYEVFLAQMSRQNDIAYFGSTTAGYPKLAGLQLSVTPAPGYAVSLNRLMQYGGGARGARLSDFLDAITVNSNRPDVAGTSQEFGNQVASLASTILFPGKVPFAVKMEFAGEDNSYAGSYRLGDSALMLGVDFPSLAGRFDATYEFSDWQNVWYTHHIYPDGLTNHGDVLGHWFGDQRARGDKVTGSSHLLRVGLRTDSGAYWQASWRTAGFGYPLGQSALQGRQYQHLHQASLKYSTAWRGKGVDTEIYGGRGAFEGGYGGLRASMDFAGFVLPVAGMGDVSGEGTDFGVTFFVDAGVNNSHMRDILLPDAQFNWTGDAVGYHVGVGLRRPVSESSDLGTRIELDNMH